jgi:hypothetical protein
MVGGKRPWHSTHNKPWQSILPRLSIQPAPSTQTFTTGKKSWTSSSPILDLDFEASFFPNALSV